MESDEKTKLAIDNARYERIKSIQSQQGWEEIQKIIFEVYHEALDIATSGGVSDEVKIALGVVKGIKDLMTRIDQTKKMLEDANRRYMEIVRPQ